MFCVSLKIRFVKLSCFICSAQSPGCILILRKTDDERLDHSGLVPVWHTDMKRRLSLNLHIILCYLTACNTGLILVLAMRILSGRVENKSSWM